VPGAAPLLMAAVLAAAGGRTEGGAREAVFERFKASIVTVEVHPVAGQARSVLGSGYVVGPGARIVTNYHVVGSYVEHPERYRLQVKGARGVQAAKLLAFDLVNDLALLEAPLTAPVLKLATSPGNPGAPIIAFGDPEGLGLSLIEGVFNGFAEKGFVDRMLLSMPLNSGMSGGPILNSRLEVVGTNVAVSWRSNSLSFGVPVTAVHALLAAPPVATGREALRAESDRQLAALDRRALERAVLPFAQPEVELIAVGGAQMPKPPEAYECWHETEELETEGLTKNTFECNLQFTPSVEDLDEVASIEIEVEHFRSRKSRYGFYGGLGSHASEHHGVEARAPGNGLMSPPACRSDRVRADHLAWKATTCSYAYVPHPSLGYFAMVATSVSRPEEAVYVAVHGRGVGLDTFLALSRSLLRGIRLTSTP
jgi:trypsin-like peptidase